MPLMCPSSSIREVHLGFSAGVLCYCSLPGPLHPPLGSGYLGTASALAWMAPGGAAEEARTQTHHMCSQLTRREWSHLCKTWLCPSLQSSLLVQEGWQRTGTVTQSTSVLGPGMKYVNTAAAPLPVAPGGEIWHICGVYDRTEHHRKKWGNSLQ